jgi:hypothetical protein
MLRHNQQPTHTMHHPRRAHTSTMNGSHYMNRQQKASDQILKHDETAETYKLSGQTWHTREAWSVSVWQDMELHKHCHELHCVIPKVNFILFILYVVDKSQYSVQQNALYCFQIFYITISGWSLLHISIPYGIIISDSY